MMRQYESFGDCVKRCLREAGLSASNVARLVGFRSRNSIFRILSGDTSDEIKRRFLDALYGVLKDEWPAEHWARLQEALSVERLGAERYEANCAFERLLHEQEEPLQANVQQLQLDGDGWLVDLGEILDTVARADRAEIVITGCCDSALSLLLAQCCGAAGEQGRLRIRHYIDTATSTLTQQILGILPLVSKPWYNARLVQPDSCAKEMLALYRMHALHICCRDAAGNESGGMLIRFDKTHFSTQWHVGGAKAFMQVLDQLRFDLELLKPMPHPADGAEAFVEYTARYARLEENCAILSIKPDVHFNCIPATLLEQSIRDGFEQSGMAAGPELEALMEALKQVHNGRFDNMRIKHKPTHLVYSLEAMVHFMRTGVLTDHFFIQRAYTVEERREIVRTLAETMRSCPWFNIHFLKAEVPSPRYEISSYDGKGVLLMSAYTGYELNADHSEALITLPAFMESFRSYFIDELLVSYVMSRADTLRELDRLLVMNIQE